MKIPNWAQELVIDTVIYLKEHGYDVELPELKWRKAPGIKYIGRSKLTPRDTSSGTCALNEITINYGTDRRDTKLVLLHELAHWALPIRRCDQKAGHEGHTPRFWDLAWELYSWAGIPQRYCLQRERHYRQGAVEAFKRLK